MVAALRAQRAVAAHRDLPQLDEKLYLDVFAPPETVVPRRASARR